MSMDVDRSMMIQENRQISIQLEQLGNRAMAQKGLTAIQAHMLLYILEHSEEGTSLTDIHQHFGYSMAALSSVTKRLREKGYVRAEPCARDDRRKLLFGTRKGEAVQETLDRLMCSSQDQLYSGFSQEELTTLDRLQRKMLRNRSALMQQDSKELTQP